MMIILNTDIIILTGKLIRYIDENGEVSDYEDGTDIIGSDLYEWADAM